VRRNRKTPKIILFERKIYKMRIQHNVMAMNAYRNYNNNTSALAKNLEKLSSGYKINRAGDDAAGLAISEKMRAQITGLSAAQKNVKDGISLVKTAEGAMQEIHDMLNRMDYLATQSANGTYDNSVDRYNLQKEVDALRAEIDRIAESANFNGIKLLDGSLGESAELTTELGGVEVTSAEAASGAIKVENNDAEGSYGTYSFTIGNTFGSGDKLTLTFGSGDPTNNSVTNLLHPDNSNANMELAFGDEFEGKTAEEQAQSIADHLKKNADVTKNFEVSVNGKTVTLKNLKEGDKEITLTSVVASDAATSKQAVYDDNTTKETATVAAGATQAKFLLTDIFAGNSGVEFQEGGKIEISITDQNNHVWKATVDIEEGDTNAATHEKIVAALNKTDDAEAVYFENTDGTVADESKFKFSDLFTASATKADGTAGANEAEKVCLQLAGKAGSEIFKAKGISVQVYKADGTATGAAKTATDATAADGTPSAFDVVLDNVNGDAEYSVGDVITLNGSLSDGRTFQTKLTAGTDFEIGEDHAGTLTNMVNALTAGGKSDGVDVTITNDDGTTETVNSKEIFAADTSKEIQVASNGTKLTFTSSVKSNKNNGKINSAAVTPAPIGSVTSKLKNGNQQTGATTDITFEDGKVTDGSTVTVAGQTYYITDQDGEAQGNEIRVKVDDLNDGAAIASALKDAIQGKIDEDAAAGTAATFDVAVDGSTVTLTTKAVGEAAENVAVSANSGGEQDALTFTLDPQQVTSRSRVNIRGQEYEFVTSEDKATKNKKGDNLYNVVVVENLNVKEGDGAVTSKQLADALKEAVDKNVYDAENNPEGDKISIDVDDAGQVTIKSTDFKAGEDGSYSYEKLDTSMVSFYRKGGLTLQIGDTSDDYNQMNVIVNAVHTNALKLDGIDIGTQEGAQDAIEVIKNAINYVSDVRGDLGATQNRLEHTANNLSVMAENIQDAESTIRDTDVAEEMMSYVKNNILIQSAQAMLAQANQVPQGVLQLLG